MLLLLKCLNFYARDRMINDCDNNHSGALRNANVTCTFAQYLSLRFLKKSNWILSIYPLRSKDNRKITGNVNMNNHKIASKQTHARPMHATQFNQLINLISFPIFVATISNVVAKQNRETVKVHVGADHNKIKNSKHTHKSQYFCFRI